jgi:hypothetical protein
MPAALRDPGVVAALVAPSLALLAVLKITAGPAVSVAAPLDPSMMSMSMDAPGIDAAPRDIPVATPADLKAFEHASERAAVPIDTSPLIQPDAPQKPGASRSAPVAGMAPVGATPAAAPAASKPAAAPKLDLTTVMQTRSGPVAIIGGRLLRVGDAPTDGWTIVEIQVRHRRIQIRHDTGRIEQLRL